MSEPRDDRLDPDIPDEIDFTDALPNKFARSYAEGTNVILLDPDLRDVFPDSDAVNAALRPLADLIRTHSGRTE